MIAQQSICLLHYLGVGTCFPGLQYAYDRIMEGEGRDRTSLKLNPNQEALWKVGARAVSSLLN